MFGGEERRINLLCTVLSALSAGASLYSGIAQSRNARAQANAQANALETNARNSELLAHDAIERGGLEELRLRRSLAQNAGNQNVQAASSGIDVNSGSVINARNSSIAEGEFDAEAIKFNAARERWGYLSQAHNLSRQAAYSRAVGNSSANNILFGNVINWGLKLGNDIYEGTKDTENTSPLTDNEDRSKYWGPVYNPIERRRRGYSS